MTRTKTIRVRLTPIEHEQLKAKAGTRGVSAILRLGALGLDARAERKERLLLVAEIARARNILNQIARTAEQRPHPEQLQVITRLIDVERQLMKLNRPC